MKRYYVLLCGLVFSQSLISQVHVDQNNKVGIGGVPTFDILRVYGNANILDDRNSVRISNTGWGGFDNIFLGFDTGSNNTNAQTNIGIGNYVLDNVSGDGNLAIGTNALKNTVDGYRNVAIGEKAGYNGVSTSNCVYLGARAGQNNLDDNRLFISGPEHYNHPLIYGEFENRLLQIKSAIKLVNYNGSAYPATIKFHYGNDKYTSISKSSNGSLAVNFFGGPSNTMVINGQLKVNDLIAGVPAKMLARDANNHIVETTPSFTNPTLSIGGSHINLSSVNYWSKVGNNIKYNNNVSIGTAPTTDKLRVLGNANILDSRGSVRINNTGLGGARNVFIGIGAGDEGNALASYNVGVGEAALNLNEGQNNVAIGRNTFRNNVRGNNNVVLGANAGLNSGSVNGCVYLGPSAGYYNSLDHRLFISGVGLHSSPLVYGKFDEKKLQVMRNLSVRNYSGDLALFQMEYGNGISTDFTKQTNGTLSIDFVGGSSNTMVLNGQLKINDLSAGTPVKMLARDANNHIVDTNLPSAGIGGIEVGNIINSVAQIIDDSGNPQFYITSDDLHVKIDEPSSNIVNITQQNHIAQLICTDQSIANNSAINFDIANTGPNSSISSDSNTNVISTSDPMGVVAFVTGNIRQ